MPLVSRTFDQLIDFTRTSAGTYVDETGKIVSTPASRNLLLFTQEFDNAVWSKTAATVTANTTTAPDGTSTADKIVATATTGFHGVFQSVTGTVASYTLSVYAKAAEYSKLQLANSGGGTWSATFDLETGTTIATGGASVLSSSIQSAGSGWYRCSVTFTGAASLTAHSITGYPNTGATLNNFGASYAGDGTSGIFVWGAQLEQASAATTYTRNYGGLFPPRFDYDPVTLAPKGLLIEEQRTNLLTYSAQFDNAAWVKSGTATVTANTTTSPDGTVNADTLNFPATADSVSQAASVSVAGGASITASVWLWGTAGQTCRIFVAGTNSGANYEATALPITLTTTPTRYTLTFTPTTAKNFVELGIQRNTGQTAAAVFAWGAQLEAGAFATSYIPTVASQVTRTADQPVIQAPMFAPWYNQSAGTFAVEADTFAPAGAGRFVVSASSSRIFAYLHSAASNGGIYDGTNLVLSANAATIGSVFKLATAFDTSGQAACLNGAAVASGSYSGGFSGSSSLSLGGGATGTFLNGHIRSIRYYPTRLSNAQLQALTA